MRTEDLRRLLEGLREGSCTVEEALEELRRLPFEDLGFAKLDHHRELRRGVPEAIWGADKDPQQIVEIARRMLERGQVVLVTKVPQVAARWVAERLPQLRYHHLARMLTSEPLPPRGQGIVVVTAGTSDIPIAEEAALTAETLGHRVERIYDVGVAGVHRLLGHWERLRAAGALVVVAGMEGALPGAVAGLVERPVIAVPTSIGYGASFGGLAALLTMLNSCAPGVAVVNIDNGFGAGYLATLVDR